MIYAVNYSNDLYRDAQKFNTKSAYKYGADKVIEYTYEELPEQFVKEHSKHFACKRGNGLWVWKPSIILDALSKIEYGDYLVYIDAGAAYVNNIKYLIEAMDREGSDVMPFAITQYESQWSKRDAFILMDCDKAEIVNSPQYAGGYIVVKKTEHSVDIIRKYMEYASNYRIVSEDPSVLGKDYDNFIANRHDQTAWSLLCKKEGVAPFRDPSEFGTNHESFSEEVNARSAYPQIVESHRLGDIKYAFELAYERQKHPILSVIWIGYRVSKKIKSVLKIAH